MNRDRKTYLVDLYGGLCKFNKIMQQLKRIRNLINDIDREMVAKLKRRLSLALKTSKYKEVSYDPFRERDIMQRVPKEIKTVFREIISVCRNSERRMRVCFSKDEELMCGIHFLGLTTNFLKVKEDEKFRMAKEKRAFAIAMYGKKEFENVYRQNLFIWAKFLFNRKPFILVGQRRFPESPSFPLLVMVREKEKRSVKYTELKLLMKDEYEKIIKKENIIIGVYPEDKND